MKQEAVNDQCLYFGDKTVMRLKSMTTNPVSNTILNLTLVLTFKRRMKLATAGCKLLVEGAATGS